MRARNLRCVNCGEQYDLGLRYHCPACHFPLEVVYSPPDPGQPYRQDGPGIWRYPGLLSLVPEAQRVSLGEGDTPLVHSRRLGRELGLPNLYIKNEGQNPTGSFKDRPTAVGVSAASMLGIDTLVVSSTGNAGAALAAYAARAGMRALIFVREGTPPAKLTQMAVHAAQIVPVRGTLSDAFWLAYNAALEWGWMDLTSTFLCPYTVEGDRTVAYELYAQLGRAPDWIVVPVSVGPLLVGIYKGFLELQERGLVATLPRMVAAQAAGCAPIASAYRAGADSVQAWEAPAETVAGGIADPLRGYEQDGTYALRVTRASGGCATASSDEEILAAAHSLASFEGIFAEPSGAVSLAALKQLRAQPGFSPDQLIVCLVTGHGLKQVRSFEDQVHLPAGIEPRLEDLENFLETQANL